LANFWPKGRNCRVSSAAHCQEGRISRVIFNGLLEREVAELPDIPSAIRALEEGRWGDEQAKAAAFIRRRMEEEGVWGEQSKKHPAKDKPYQRTLKVKACLDA